MKDIDAIIAILDEGKKARKHRGLSAVKFVNVLEIERWPTLGVVDRSSLSGSVCPARNWRSHGWRRIRKPSI